LTEAKIWKVIVWAAVSSKPQVEDKVSLRDQEAAGVAFAERIGGRVVDVLRVEGHSRDYVLYAEAEAEMEAYQRLREHCQRADFDVLWCRDPDRLGRDAALVQTVASLVARSGGELFCASAPHVLGQATVGGRYTLAIQAVRAQEDQATRISYIKMGMRERVANGLPANHWPIGYRAVKDPVSGETTGGELDGRAPAVRLATDLFLAGRSYGDIVAALDRSPYRPPAAARWSYSTLRGMLMNDCYAGYVSWGDYHNPEVSDRFPALWDPETHLAVQRERGRRAFKINAPSTGTPFLDVAFCARCGGRMTMHRRTGSHVVYLRCGRHARRNMGGRDRPGCHPNHTRQERVQEAVVAFLEGITDLHDVERLRGRRRDDHRQRARLEEIAAELAGAEVRRHRLALAYAAEVMDLMVYQAADQEIERQIASWEGEQRELEAALARTARDGERLAAVRTARPLLERTLAGVGAREMSTALQEAGIRVWCENGQVVKVEMI